MATWYIDQRATGGLNNGTSPANAWLSLFDSAYGTNSGSVAAGDTVEVVAGSGPYYEATNQGATFRRVGTDISFDAATRTITSTAQSFSAFVAGDIIRVMGSALNDGQYQVASVAGTGPFTLVVAATCNLRNESAGRRIRIVDIQQASQGSSRVPMVFDQGRSGGAGNPIVWNFNGNVVSAGIPLDSPRYVWRQSVARPGEWYCVREDGSNPCLIQPESAVVGGLFQCQSATREENERGTVGSLAFDRQYGFGNIDSLGFNTVYVRSGRLSPVDRGWSVIVGQLQYCMWQAWNNHDYRDAIFEYANGITPGVLEGASVNSRGANARFLRCVARYASGHGWEAQAQGPVTLDHCVTFFAGHRGVNLTGNIVLRVLNHVDIGSHLFGLIAAAVTSSGAFIARGCISYGNEAGAIDCDSSAVVFDESHNLWFPTMDDPGGDLANGSSATRWSRTSPFDVPPSRVTTEDNPATLTDPLFVRIDYENFDRCDFRLASGSPAIGRGQWTDALGVTPTDYYGASFTRRRNIGVDQADYDRPVVLNGRAT